MLKRLLCVPTIALALLGPTTGDAKAWGPDGHRIVAEIAFKLLPPHKAAAIDQLLRNSTLRVGFIEASIYADLVIRQQNEKFDPWHFVNWTISEPYSDQFCKKPKEEELTCIIAQLPIQIKEAGSNADPNARALAISWVIHLIGDLHQPLHVGDKKDGGGNGFPVTYRGKNTCGPPAFPLAMTEVQLHRVWDHCLVYDLVDGREWWRVADEIRGGLTTYKGQASAAGDSTDWARQTNDLARDYVYQGIERRDDLDAAYIVRAMAVVREQLLRAGIRLARVLDEIY